MYIDDQLVIGIFAGLISATIIFIGSKFFNCYLLNKISEKIYQVANISGTWTVFYSEISIDKPVGYINVCQSGYTVTAELELNKSQHGIDIKRTYVYHGKFSAAKLALIFEDKESRGEYSGALVMHLEPDNHTLNGKAMYYCHKTNDVVYTVVSFKKGKV